MAETRPTGRLECQRGLGQHKKIEENCAGFVSVGMHNNKNAKRICQFECDIMRPKMRAGTTQITPEHQKMLERAV